MTPAGGRGVGRRAAASAAGVGVLVVLLVAACGGSGAGSAADPGSPGRVAGSTPAAGSEAAATSPATGVLVKIDAQGLTKVTGFRLRTNDGMEIPFAIGVLENGAEFPPGHLAEHMATSSPVKVFFRDEGGTLVVYRLEDGP